MYKSILNDFKKHSKNNSDQDDYLTESTLQSFDPSKESTLQSFDSSILSKKPIQSKNHTSKSKRHSSKSKRHSSKSKSKRHNSKSKRHNSKSKSRSSKSKSHGSSNENLLNDDHNLPNDKKITYVWQDVSKEWKTKLMADNFVIKNCFGDGNCQFRSIETALTNSGYKTNHKHLRNIIAKYITRIENPEFFNIVQNYRIEKQNNEFIGDWDPFEVKNKRDFIKQIRRTGFHFQGDYITLSLISKAIKIDIVLFNHDYTITDLSNPNDLQPKIIILYYDNDHYQTIGIKKRVNVQSIFLRTNLPKELEMVLDKNTFLLRHIQNVCEKQNCNKIQLNRIINIIENNIQSHVSNKDKRKILELLKTWLENKDFFNKIKKSTIRNNP